MTVVSGNVPSSRRPAGLPGPALNLPTFVRVIPARTRAARAGRRAAGSGGEGFPARVFCSVRARLVTSEALAGRIRQGLGAPISSRSPLDAQPG